MFGIGVVVQESRGGEVGGLKESPAILVVSGSKSSTHSAPVLHCVGGIGLLSGRGGGYLQD